MNSPKKTICDECTENGQTKRSKSIYFGKLHISTFYFLILLYFFYNTQFNLSYHLSIKIILNALKLWTIIKHKIANDVQGCKHEGYFATQLLEVLENIQYQLPYHYI